MLRTGFISRIHYFEIWYFGFGERTMSEIGEYTNRLWIDECLNVKTSHCVISNIVSRDHSYFYLREVHEFTRRSHFQST